MRWTGVLCPFISTGSLGPATTAQRSCASQTDTILEVQTTEYIKLCMKKKMKRENSLKEKSENCVMLQGMETH